MITLRRDRGQSGQPIHAQEKEQFKRLFEQENIDYLEERLVVVETFLQTERHLSEQELYKIIKKRNLNLAQDLITDTLDLMCRYGFAHKHQFDNGVLRYEHRHIGQHHDHMICTKCNQIIEFQNNQIENLQLQVAAQHGFHMLQHKMEIYGICANCLQSRLAVIPLTAAKKGEKLQIKQFTGGAKSRMRLMSMGLRIGDRIDVISSLNQGQLVVAVDFKRLVLGKGLAQKITVQSIGPKKGVT
jgi:Fur family ferric uptake transcriptional regulator